MEAPLDNRTLSAHARQAGTAAAIGAALLLYFGFVQLAAPTGNDLFSQSWWLLYHTLRVGGIALGIVTLWLWTGHAPALLVDGIVTGAIGAILILTGVGMLVDGGGMGQPVINVLCGGMFVSAGLYNARLYLGRSPGTDRPESAARPIDLPTRPARNQEHAESDVRTQLHETSDESQAKAPTAEEPPPPGGYLAALAKKKSS